MTVVTLTTSRRSRPSPRRRAPEIIEAAARVFAERGFHGATTQDIADVLGIRQASLYYYFPSKEGALELVCCRAWAASSRSPRRSRRDRAPPPTSSARLIKSHLSPLDRPQRFRPRVPERAPAPAAREPPADRKMVARAGAGVRKTFSRKACVAANSAPTSIPAWRSLGILGMANAVANWYRPEEVAIDRVSAEFARLLVGGVTKRPKPRRGSRRRRRSAR